MANIFESSLNIEKIEVLFQIAKNTFFQGLFQPLKKALKNVFFAILKITSIFSMFKLLSKILHGYYTTFVFLEF